MSQSNNLLNAGLVWKGKMVFESNNRGIKGLMDALPDHGGENQGPTPKELVLNGMMGCTAMDVVSILQKMRVPLDSLAMEIEVEKNVDPPVHFKKTMLIYKLMGQVPTDKAVKAIDSSLTKYCGVNYMIHKVSSIDYKLEINGQEVHCGSAHFIDPVN